MRAVNSFIEYFIASDATLKSKPHRLERLKWSNSATKNKIKEQTNQTGQGCTQVVGLLPTRKHPPYFSQFAVNTHVLCTRQKRGKKKPSSSSYYVPFRWWWSQHGCSLPFYELLCSTTHSTDGIGMPFPVGTYRDCPLAQFYSLWTNTVRAFVLLPFAGRDRHGP